MSLKSTCSFPWMWPCMRSDLMREVCLILLRSTCKPGLQGCEINPLLVCGDLFGFWGAVTCFKFQILGWNRCALFWLLGLLAQFQLFSPLCSSLCPPWALCPVIKPKSQKYNVKSTRRRLILHINKQCQPTRRVNRVELIIDTFYCGCVCLFAVLGIQEVVPRKGCWVASDGRQPNTPGCLYKIFCFSMKLYNEFGMAVQTAIVVALS